MIRRSVGLSAASKYTQFVLSLASNVVLARILTPDAIGLYAVAAVLAGMVQLFRDMGIGQYLTREPELTRDKIRVAFTLMVGAAWVLGAALIAISEAAAGFYDKPELAAVLRIQALTFLIVPFGAVNLTLLKRQFQFGRTYMIDVVSNVCHLATAITLAVAGWGAQSLAWASVVGVAMTSVGAMLARRGDFVYRPTLRGARAVLGFGGVVAVTRVLGSLGRDIPELMIGKSLGTSPLAFFSKALLPTTIFSQFIMAALNPVLLPAFSKKHREDDIEGPFLHAVACMAALVIPGLILLACLSDWVVMLLFGPQWGKAVEPMRIFALSTALASTTALFSSLFVALGHPRAPLNVQMVLVPARVGLVALAMPHGLVAVAWTWLASGVFGAVVQFRQLEPLAGIKVRDVARAIAPSVYIGGMLAGLIGLGVWWLAPPVTVLNGLLVLGGAGFLLCLLWYAALAALRHPLYVESRSLLRAVGRSRIIPQ